MVCVYVCGLWFVGFRNGGVRGCDCVVRKNIMVFIFVFVVVWRRG